MDYTNPENNNQDEQQKMSMADRFITAMFTPREYGKLLQLRSGSVIGFLALVIFLISFIQYAIPTLGAVAGMGGIRNIIENQIPQFSLKDGVFTLDEKIEQQDNSIDAGRHRQGDYPMEQFPKKRDHDNKEKLFQILHGFPPN